MTSVVIFGDTSDSRMEAAYKLHSNTRKYVSYMLHVGRLSYEIPEKDMFIRFYPGDMEKAAGLRPDYVVFYDVTIGFRECWEYVMKGRYTELSLKELIELIIGENKEEK